MSAARRARCARQTPRAALATLCVMSLAACSAGYPTEDVPLIDPADMTQAQLLEALDANGDQPYLGKRWRYALHADCELEVSVRDGKTVRHRVSLQGAKLSTRSVDDMSQMRLVPESGDDAQAVTVLETRRWADTVKVRSLLTHLEMLCGAPELPAA
jgi:hypothetical protein